MLLKTLAEGWARLIEMPEGLALPLEQALQDFNSVPSTRRFLELLS
jgi:hypothetical protein